MEPTRRRERRRRNRGRRDVAVVVGILVIIVLLLLAWWAFSPAGVEVSEEQPIPSNQEEVAKDQPKDEETPKGQPEQEAPPQQAAPSSSAAGRQGLVGTWEVTETNLDPNLGGGLLTFSEDGTFQAQPLPVEAPELIFSGEYRVDDSHITFIESEGEETQTEYTLEGDTLTTRTVEEDPEFPIDEVTTYQRKS